MIRWIAEPWTFPFMQWALVCCLVLAGVHAYLGFHIVRRGVLFVDLAMAQAAALGAALGVVLGMEHDTFGEYALSASFALATAVVLSRLRGRRVHPEAVVAIVYGLTTAATFVVLEHSPHGMDEVKHLFVGQILTVPPQTVAITAGLYIALGALLRWLHPKTLALTEGRPVERRGAVELLFYSAFALVVTSSVGLAGVLLVFALLVLPAVAALFLPGGPAARLAWGWGFAGAGCLVGLHTAYHWDQPAAPVIVLALGVMLLIAVGLGRANLLGRE